MEYLSLVFVFIFPCVAFVPQEQIQKFRTLRELTPSPLGFMQEENWPYTATLAELLEIRSEESWPYAAALVELLKSRHGGNLSHITDLVELQKVRNAIWPYTTTLHDILRSRNEENWPDTAELADIFKARNIIIPSIDWNVIDWTCLQDVLSLIQASIDGEEWALRGKPHHHYLASVYY